MPRAPLALPLPVRFFAALAALRDEFPQVYVEAWTPDDFLTPDDADAEEPESVGLAWDSARALSVAEILQHEFDANRGTHWARVEDVVRRTEPDAPDGG